MIGVGVYLKGEVGTSFSSTMDGVMGLGGFLSVYGLLGIAGNTLMTTLP